MTGDSESSNPITVCPFRERKVRWLYDSAERWGGNDLEVYSPLNYWTAWFSSSIIQPAANTGVFEGSCPREHVHRRSHRLQHVGDAAIAEVLERKGLCTKHDLYDIITEFRRKNPRAKIPEKAFPEPYLLAETENTIIDDILELLNKHGLTSHQSMNLLERLGGIIEMEQRVAKGTTH